MWMELKIVSKCTLMVHTMVNGMILIAIGIFNPSARRVMKSFGQNDFCLRFQFSMYILCKREYYYVFNFTMCSNWLFSNTITKLLQKITKKINKTIKRDIKTTTILEIIKR